MACLIALWHAREICFSRCSCLFFCDSGTAESTGGCRQGLVFLPFLCVPE
jgi:hypothetical protein